MKKVLLLFCVSFLVLGFGGCHTGDQAAIPPTVGVFPTPGYVPNAEDMEAAPYTFTGFSDTFELEGKVYPASEQDIALLLSQKEATIRACEQSKLKNPDNVGDYNLLIEKTEQEIASINSAKGLYVTQIQWRFLGNSREVSSVQMTVSHDGMVYLSFAGNASGTITLMNTKDGSYSEGILLPKKQAYDVTIQCQGKEEDIVFHLAS